MPKARKRKEEKKKKLTKFQIIFPLALGGVGTGIAFAIQFFISGPPPLEQCVPSEDMSFHQHAYLNVTLDGNPFTVPANVGITQSCTKPLHTRDTDGVIHTEFVKPTRFTLGEFIKLWGLNLNQYNVKIFVKSAGDADFREVKVSDINTLVLKDKIMINMELNSK